MNIPSLSDLYEYYDILINESTAQEDKEKTFRSLLLGTKGGDKEKRLACQFIARFSKLFTNLQEESFNCILDLCDDDDVNIRKQAAHDLLQFCKRLRVFIPRTADVLVQMFQTDDTSELQMISLGLSQLLHIDPKATLVGIFSQLLTVNPENPRDHMMRFLAERLKTVPENLMTSEIEEFVVEQTNKVLSDVSEDEFQPLISILLSLKCMSTVPGRQKLVGMITEQALQANPVFSPCDPACVAQIRESGKQIVLCISKNVHSREMFVYFLDKVMSTVMDIPHEMSEDRLSLLRITAELSTQHTSEISAMPGKLLDQYLTSMYTVLLLLVPELPSTKKEAVQTNDGDVSDGKSAINSEKCNELLTDLKLSEVECALYIICQLARNRIEFFGSPPSSSVSGDSVENVSGDQHLGAERLRTIRPRLQYLSNVAQRYAQSIAGHLGQQSQQSGGQTSDSNGHLKVIAHRLVTTIQSLVRAFFHNPPTFKSPAPPLSWLSQTPITTAPVGQKRSSNGAGDLSTNAKVSVGPTTTATLESRRELPRYAPPMGLWSRGGRAGGRTESGRSRRGRGRRW